MCSRIMPRRFLPAAQEHFVAQSNKVFTSSMPQKNWVANMIFSTRWDNKEKDDAYTFKRHDSAAEVLLRVWRVYYFIGGTAAFIVFAGFYLTAVQESSRLESASPRPATCACMSSSAASNAEVTTRSTALLVASTNQQHAELVPRPRGRHRPHLSGRMCSFPRTG